MKILFAALMFISVSASAQQVQQRPPLPVEACQVHSPYGFAQVSRPVHPICRQGYLAAYDASAKIPNYVAYTLLPQNALGCVARTNSFVADRSVPAGPTPNDYAGTGFDKGHVAPNGDMSWDPYVEHESFLMTNMFPQSGGLNRGIWKLLETSIRGWAVQTNNSFTIYAGAIYNDQNPRIGRSGVIVPHGFYKIVINNQTGNAAGWLFEHKGSQGNDLTRVRSPIANIQQLAGVQFKYPANVKELGVGQEWSVNFGALTNAKRAKCGRAD